MDKDFVHLRSFEPDAYGESKILSEKTIPIPEPARTKAFIKRMTGLTGAAIVVVFAAVCLVLFCQLNSTDKKYDDVIKFLTLILGAVIGSVFHQEKKFDD
jgi:hypothetical protein